LQRGCIYYWYPRNGEYLGKPVLAPSEFLDRWGHYQEDITEAEKIHHKQETEDLDDEAIERLMAAAADTSEDRVNQASHVVELRLAYDNGDDNIHALSTAGEVNALMGGYAITVHKAQGSEYENVIFALHHTHATMVSRELLYTGVTRAKKRIHIICEPETFQRGVTSQRIIGNTLAEKAALFKGKALAAGDKVPVSANKLPGLLGRVYNPYLPAPTTETYEDTPNWVEIKAPEGFDVDAAIAEVLAQEKYENEIDYTLLEPQYKEKVEVPEIPNTKPADTVEDKRAALLAKLAAIRSKAK
jgi:hypothetical protein